MRKKCQWWRRIEGNSGLLSQEFVRKVYKPRSGDGCMSHERDDTQWIRRGSQRSAVVRALRKPMTATEICWAARQLSPRIQLRDVWYLLKQLQERGLVRALNPRAANGRLQELTVRGREVVQATFEIQIDPSPPGIDWRKYGQVVRARIRRLTLIQLDRLESRADLGQTATAIRKHLRPEYPVGLNPILRALKDLRRLGLVRDAGVTRLRSCMLYRLTPAGARIVHQLKC